MRRCHQVVFTTCAPARKHPITRRIAHRLVRLGLCTDEVHAATVYGAVITELMRPEGESDDTSG